MNVEVGCNTPLPSFFMALLVEAVNFSHTYHCKVQTNPILHFLGGLNCFEEESSCFHTTHPSFSGSFAYFYVFV